MKFDRAAAWQRPVKGMVNRRGILCLSASIAVGARASTPGLSQVPSLSAAPIGPAVARGWHHQEIPGVPQPNIFNIVEIEQVRVLHIRSAASASTWVAPVDVDPIQTPFLKWQWRVAHALRKSDIRSRDTDDYAARVYVVFDLPLEQLSLTDRLRLQTTRLMSKIDVPTAALCYVWGNLQNAGESGWNPYTDRQRMIVVDSGNTHAGQWRPVVRNVAQDWADAFGGPVPRISGVVLGCDTDNTGDATDAWFGDLRFAAAP